MDNEIFQNIVKLKIASACGKFFEQIFTTQELSAIAMRFRGIRSQENIRIAVQSRGRLADDSISFLSNAGLIFNPNGKNCLVSCENYGADILFLRDDDIPRYIAGGVVDFGIVGENIIAEQNAKVDTVKQLGFGTCRLVIAIPETSQIKKIKDLAGKRIATTYPNILRTYLKQNAVKAKIILLKGSVEVAPVLNLADAICDLTQTGKTLKENNLKPIITVFDSQAVLIQTPKKTKRTSEQILSLFNAKKL